ncbi:Opsin-5 [Dissostichus eleginoides]|uniref:Opsin-5 n=1 Tax=Dissostichus eleginoides TaxID=100907 RepID=A0AAD9CDC4_DISEL|nr:Opsin-5 [Dissostichus eleginoides]
MGNASDTSAVFASTISKEHDIIMGSLYGVFCVLSLVGNCILLLVAYHKRSTLKPAEFFIINLSISDLGMTLSLFPLAIPSAFKHRWLFGEITCQLYAMCGVLFGLCSLTNLTALSLVCCLKVCFPNHGNKFSSSHARLLVVGVWCYASVFAVGPLAQWGHYSAEPYGTACCIDWKTRTTNAHSLIVKLSVAVCIGFLGSWSPYAIVAMWAAFGDAALVPPEAFAIAAVCAKSSTIYNPLVYLLCKPNFRECLYRDTSMLRKRIYRGSPMLEPKEHLVSASQRNKDVSLSTRFSNGQQESYGALLHCTESAAPGHVDAAQRTPCNLTASPFREVTFCQLSTKPQAELV